ncbi:hypothetical protein DFJ67_0995 [Asanoa ferruginea]|uniref:DUF4350 domain-containing protein n=1 Tax=Asanoa ferruginea TaxID=53367 RepID=A0A3D9ZCR0_9ACTN|nr:DUF4350 domain-containing protein [Asanoa ferruginea]REF95047.1 hypothetical protein DFJ67_0995 [Asanoa ferruginea]GIF48861.1 hypothetical protein Afe04nite_34000 [Asanoa ferruginea]
MTTTATGNRRAALRQGWRAGKRTIIPFGVVVLLLVGSLVTHAVDTPDTDDADFLSPTSSAPIGSARLADALRQRGITVTRQTDPHAALADVGAGGTLFVPAAEFLDPLTTSQLASLPRSTRVVLVDPPARTLETLRAPVQRGQRRWATAVESAGDCAIAGVDTAGRAAARRQSYQVAGPHDRCYGGGVVHLGHPNDLVVVGAADPFRNDRLDEHDNSAFAAGLLSARPKLVWLDLHERYEPPAAPRPTYTLDPEQDESYLPPPDETSPPVEEPGDGGQPGPGRADGPGDRENPLGQAFPPWLWAMLATLGAALLLLILWAGRRLGPAVSEPLPVEVRSGETVLGRGRLYRRAKARGPVAEVLRRAALRRIEPALGLEPTRTPAEVVDAVAVRTGRRPYDIDGLLFGPEPAHDDELLDLARGLDTLADEITAGAPRADTPPGTTGPDQGEPR